jgi:hypothetical protein
MAKQTAHQPAQRPEDFAMRSLRYTKDQFEDALDQTERYVRKNPGQAVLYAFAIGYVLNRLPVGRLISGVLKLSVSALKPAFLVYGATKLYQAVNDES